MDSGLRTLIRLWGFDREIQALKRELQSFPREERKRRVRLEELRGIHDHGRETLQGLQSRVSEIENSVSSWRERIIKLERESFGARDQSLVYAYKHQIDSLRGEIDEHEGEGLKLLEEVSRIEAHLAAQRQKVEAEEEVMAAFMKNVEEEIARIEARMAELDAVRKEILPDVSAMHLALYEKLLASSDRAPLAAVVDGVCQGCFTSLVPNDIARVRSGKMVVQCKSCIRILYTP